MCKVYIKTITKKKIIPEFYIRVAIALGRLLPTRLCVKIAAYQQKKKINN